jgi:hypothetical protein
MKMMKKSFNSASSNVHSFMAAEADMEMACEMAMESE